jgi:hypothetical protein
LYCVILKKLTCPPGFSSRFGMHARIFSIFIEDLTDVVLLVPGDVTVDGEVLVFLSILKIYVGSVDLVTLELCMYS